MNYDVVSFFKKWLLDIRDTQRPNGQICCIVPTSGWGYNWGSGPAWDSILIQLPYLIYHYTGDKTAIEEMWDSMVMYMEFMDSMADDYCVCFGLGDWCPPPDTDICPTIITDTAYYYTDNRIMAKCAAIIHKNGDYYEKQADAIKERFRKNTSPMIFIWETIRQQLPVRYITAFTTKRKSPLLQRGCLLFLRRMVFILTAVFSE